jgi:ABC-2 type transport system ATP-binding protein
MNLLSPTEGRATVLGKDSMRLGSDEFAKIGYVSENQRLPGWMTVQQFIDFCRPMYASWDNDLCSRILKEFLLPTDRKIRHLSRGMKMKVSLLTSLAYRPRLLVLDEPFTGLDPTVRDELIHGILEITEQQNWSVFISSHDIDDVERFADWAGFIEGGKLRLSEPTADLRNRFKRIDRVVSHGAHLPSPAPDSWLGLENSARSFCVIESQYVTGDSEDRVRRLMPGATDLNVSDLSLREIFVGLTHSYRGKP